MSPLELTDGDEMMLAEPDPQSSTEKPLESIEREDRIATVHPAYKDINLPRPVLETESERSPHASPETGLERVDEEESDILSSERQKCTDSQALLQSLPLTDLYAMERSLNQVGKEDLESLGMEYREALLSVATRIGELLE